MVFTRPVSSIACAAVILLSGLVSPGPAQSREAAIVGQGAEFFFAVPHAEQLLDEQLTGGERDGEPSP